MLWQRASHLNWALVSLRESHQKFKRKALKNQPLVFKSHN
ncbi:acetyltransferase [Vibrio cholerae]|nr:acetyltransferase [Vibrio cholerae]EGR2018124.1 acetyltransferase [Vibrio cholerae]EGR2446411.1 acetyltransferase [Vibrio cholerae]